MPGPLASLPQSCPAPALPLTSLSKKGQSDGAPMSGLPCGHGTWEEAKVTGPQSRDRCSKLRGRRAQNTLYSVAALLTGFRKSSFLLKRYLLGPALGAGRWAQCSGQGRWTDSTSFISRLDAHPNLPSCSASGWLLSAGWGAEGDRQRGALSCHMGVFS